MKAWFVIYTGELKREGNEDWKIKFVGNLSLINIKYPWLIPKFLNIPRGTRLISQCIAGLKIRIGITNQERKVIIEVLYNRDAGIAFDFMEKGVFVGTCILYLFLLLFAQHILLILLLFHLFLVSISVISIIYYDISSCSYSYSTTRIFITHLTQMHLFTSLFVYATLFHI